MQTVQQPTFKSLVQATIKMHEIDSQILVSKVVSWLACSKMNWFLFKLYEKIIDN